MDHAHLAKLDRENEVAPPAKVAPSVGKAIGQTRQEKGMTQKDLGTKINEKPQVIAEYESGKAIPNPAILAKLEVSQRCERVVRHGADPAHSAHSASSCAARTSAHRSAAPRSPRRNETAAMSLPSPAS